MPPETPIPPWGSNPRRGMSPPQPSPFFSRTAFRASAGRGPVSEHPCVMLFEWWLARVEGDDEKIAIGGFCERNHTVVEFAPERIAKRHEPCVLETEGGIVLLICGSPNIERMLAYGYSSQVCEKFMIGFPCWWESCNQLYPKEISSHAGCPPSSCNTSNSKEDSRLFYLKMFQQGERLHSYGQSLLSKLNSVFSSSHNDAAFQKSSVLPNGAPRFEECTSDGEDVPTPVCLDVQIASYLPKENAAASNDGERDEAVCNEVDNVETDLTSAVECGNDVNNKEADNAPSTSEDLPTSVCLDVQNSSYLPNENAAASNDDGETDEAVCNEVDNVDTDLTLALVCANDANNEEADNARSTSDKRTPMVSLKMQGCWEKTHITSSKKAAIDEGMPTSFHLDVQKSSILSNETPRFEKNTYIGDISTNGDAAASNDNSERCTDVPNEMNSVETVLIVDSNKRERSHDGITTNVSLAPTVECTNDAFSKRVHNNSLLGCKKTPVASLKSQGCKEKHQHTPSIEKPSGPPKKQRSALEKLQGPTRSPFTSPIPYAHESPLTRGRTTLLSMSTPEALRLRKTRSGRVVVPTLDAGCQRIVYDMDGTIAGVVGLDSPSPKGSKLKPSATKERAEPAAVSKSKMSQKKRNAEPGAASKLNTDARKKRSAEPAAANKLKTSYARKKRRAK